MCENKPKEILNNLKRLRRLAESLAVYGWPAPALFGNSYRQDASE